MTAATKARVRAPKSDYPGALKCRRKFLRFFPEGFYDETYVDWERDYKWDAHERWAATLSHVEFRGLLKSGDYQDAARRAVNLDSKTNLLFSFEKMALRDAVKSVAGSRAFTEGLYEWIYGTGDDRKKFDRWCDVVASLPRKQTRVLTWPLVTVFGFLALPEKHFFLKPMVTKVAAQEYGFDFKYRSKPNWDTYSNLLEFAEVVRDDLADLEPRDMIDIQSFLWVQGSSEYD
jgi:hypothetical protein